MITLQRVSFLLVTLLPLGGCAYAPLKAPCGPDEDAAALSYAEPPRASLSFPLRDACGPMRPVRGDDGR